MKKLIFPIMIAIAAIFTTSSLQATHIQGMNITYKHINGDTFEVNLDFFRYCGGTAFNNGNCTGAAGISNTAYYYALCEDNGWNSGSQPAPADTIREATPICDSLNATQNSCIVGNCGLLGIQWGVYTAELVLDSAFHGGIECDNWMFVYASGARNTGVNYTSQPSIVAYARLDYEEDPTNSSVQFNSAKPIPFFCDGQEVTYNWSAFDPDGDSLVWRLDTAWNNFSAATGVFNSINYSMIVGYDTFEGLDPMPGEITVNSATGQLNFTATIPPGYNFANYAIAVLVEEYDFESGEFRGSVHRDIQFIVLDSCANLAPADTSGITNFQGSGVQLDSNTIVVCTGQDFEFELLYYDYDTSGALSSGNITSTCNIDQILPGAIWTSSGTNPDTVKISWTAVPTNQVLVPFNVTVEDDFCPVTGFNVYSYTIRIEPSTFLQEDTAMCELDTIFLDANGGDTFWWDVLAGGDPIDLGVNFGCENCAKPWVQPAYTTTYVVESNLEEACGNKDTITIEVFNKFPINITPDSGGTADELVYCSTDPLDTLLVETPGGTFVGSGIVNTVDGVFAPDIVDPGSGRDTLVQIIYFLEGICANADTIGIRVKGTPDARVATEGPFCEQTSSVQLEGLFTITNNAFQDESWMNADSSNNPNNNGVLNPSAFNAPDTITVYHTVNDSGCVGFDSARLVIVGEYNSAIDSLPKICEGEEIEVYLNDFEGDPFGSWSGGEYIDEVPAESGNYYFNAKDKGPGEYDITYEITGDCGTSSTSSIIVSELPDARFYGADSVYCDNIRDSVLLEAEIEGGRWGGSLTELHDGFFVPRRVGEGTYTISYELYDPVTTCYNKNVLPVRIARTPAIPKVFGGGPYCEGYNLRNLRADGLLSNTYKWYDWEDYAEAVAINEDTVTSLENMTLLGAGNPFEYGELTQMPTHVFGTQFSADGCESGYAGISITVLPAPDAKFYAKDSTLVERPVPALVEFVNISEDGLNSDTVGIPLTFEWRFGPFGTSIEESPEFTFDQIGNYPITMVADNGTCKDSMTIYLRFDRLTSFFIPNVFTPNDDNNNDEFDWGVKGIDDFNITIYNRWGTKVFETTDIEGTWDGGDEPDGTYFYVVTGKEQTLDEEPVEYRGDLTLIRE